MLGLHVYVLLLATGGPLLAPLLHEGHGGEEANPLVLFGGILGFAIIVLLVGGWLYNRVRSGPE